MTSVDIEVFLAVCRQKNISKAAEALHITQATLSIRLKALEEELGCTLFLRGKGRRSLSLTAQGQTFYQLALQQQEILHKMHSVSQSIAQESLQLSAIHSVGKALLPPVLVRFLEKYPQVRLTLKEMDADPACLSILHGKIDLALSTAKMETDQIVATQFFREPYVIVCAQDSPLSPRTALSELMPWNEVYIAWSAEYSFWHQTVFRSNLYPFELDTMEQLPLFLRKPERWAIVPKTVANQLCEASPFRQCEPDFHIPDRLLYILRHRDYSETAGIRCFLDVLREVLQAQYGSQFLL